MESLPDLTTWPTKYHKYAIKMVRFDKLAHPLEHTGSIYDFMKNYTGQIVVVACDNTRCIYVFEPAPTHAEIAECVKVVTIGKNAERDTGFADLVVHNYSWAQMFIKEPSALRFFPIILNPEHVNQVLRENVWQGPMYMIPKWGNNDEFLVKKKDPPYNVCAYSSLFEMRVNKKV